MGERLFGNKPEMFCWPICFRQLPHPVQGEAVQEAEVLLLRSVAAVAVVDEAM